MVSVGWTLVPGSVTSLPLTVTLPWRTSSAASRREQRPPLEMYLLRGRVSVGVGGGGGGAGWAGGGGGLGGGLGGAPPREGAGLAEIGAGLPEVMGRVGL